MFQFHFSGVDSYMNNYANEPETISKSFQSCYRCVCQAYCY